MDSVIASIGHSRVILDQLLDSVLSKTMLLLLLLLLLVAVAAAVSVVAVAVVPVA